MHIQAFTFHRAGDIKTEKSIPIYWCECEAKDQNQPANRRLAWTWIQCDYSLINFNKKQRKRNEIVFKFSIHHSFCRPLGLMLSLLSLPRSFSLFTFFCLFFQNPKYQIFEPKKNINTGVLIGFRRYWCYCHYQQLRRRRHYHHRRRRMPLLCLPLFGKKRSYFCLWEAKDTLRIQLTQRRITSIGRYYFSESGKNTILLSRVLWLRQRRSPSRSLSFYPEKRRTGRIWSLVYTQCFAWKQVKENEII